MATLIDDDEIPEEGAWRVAFTEIELDLCADCALWVSNRDL